MGLKERRERERGRRRQQILNAAKLLIFRDGITSTSVSRIAKQAELGVGTLYFYFKSKEEIIAAIQDEGLEILAGWIEDAYAKGDDPCDSIKKIALAYFEFSQEKKEYFNIINTVIASRDLFFSPHIKTRADNKGYEILSFLVKSMEDGNSGGYFNSIDPERCAVMLWAMLHGLIQFEKLKGQLIRAENHKALYLDAVTHFITSIKAPLI